MTNPNVRPDLDLLLESTRQEMISEGVNGWPNAILFAQERIADLIAHIERLQNALKPFATFADTFVDADGWTGPMNVERIVDWFGPSDFREARATLSQGTSHE